VPPRSVRRLVENFYGTTNSENVAFSKLLIILGNIFLA
jgi:hypothetical protein